LEALEHNKTLTSLDISDNSDSIGPGAHTPSSGYSHVQFDLGEVEVNDVENDYPELELELLAEFAAALDKNTSLLEVTFVHESSMYSTNGVERTEWTWFPGAKLRFDAIAMVYDASLKFEDEDGQHMPWPGPSFVGLHVFNAVVLASFFPRCTSLTALSIAGNNIGLPDSSEYGHVITQTNALGGAAIARMLSCNSPLVFLDISNNGMCSLGIQHVADALAANTTLTSLNIRGNLIAKACDINDAGVASFSNDTSGIAKLAEALAMHQSLAVLDISDNELYEEAAQLVATALETNTALSNLSLGSCVVQPGWLDDVASGCIAGGTLGANMQTADFASTGLHYSDPDSSTENHELLIIAAFLPRCTLMKELDISENNIEDSIALETIRKMCLSQGIKLVDKPQLDPVQARFTPGAFQARFSALRREGLGIEAAMKQAREEMPTF
jgi:hypothetical protein